MWSRYAPRWSGGVIIAIVILWLTLTGVALIAIYIADDIMSPAFDESSVPPPKMY
jgi:hypothetical protein